MITAISAHKLENMDKKHFLEIERAKANAYNLFSSLLCEPEPELLDENAIFKNLETYLRQLLPDADINLKALYRQSPGYDIQQLRIEYARLFIGPFKVPAPPYSSLYFGEKIVMGEATVWVKNFYRHAGLEFDSGLHDLPDHVAVETEFLYYLLYNEIVTIDQGFIDDAKAFWVRQKEFTEKHYHIWVPDFCDKVIQNTNFDYFKIIFINFKLFIAEVNIPEFPNYR